MAVARTHRPVWNEQKCMPCGTCTRRCPATVFTHLALEKDSLRGQVARDHRFPTGPQKPAVEPCRAACPLGQDVPGYVRAVERGDFQRAAEIVYMSNPMPSTLGRLCVHPCMSACVRTGLDEAVDIRSVKRAAVELASSRPVKQPKTEKNGQVVVVGAGPAGLAVAFFVRRMGWQVKILEQGTEAGGLLRWAVPAFHLPRKALKADIDAVLATGIELVTQKRIESLEEIQKMLDGDASAVVLATGAGKGRKQKIPGMELGGCSDAVSFASTHCMGKGPALSGGVVVAGYTHMAVASARMARRAGADRVYLLVNRPKEISPIDNYDLDLLAREGIEILWEQVPVEARGRDGQLQQVQIAPVVHAGPDRVNRLWPVASPKSSLRTLKASTFVSATERMPDLDYLGTNSEMLSPLNTLKVGDSYETAIPGVFAVGDAATGARNVVEAVATAMRAAVGINRRCEEVAS